MPALPVPIDRLLQGYAAAVATKDAAAFMRLYDSQVRIFDAWERWSYDGAAAWQAVVQRWFDALGAQTVRVSFEATQSAGDQTLAMVSSLITYASIGAEGQPLRSMQNRITWAVRLSGQDAQIIHEHTSAPIGFSDMKAILKP
jgi:ketosteroid isomerase-like protein